MFIMLDEPILIDPGFPPPQIYIRTGGLVVEHHDIFLPAFNGAPEWSQRGTNVPRDDNDEGTPDVYVIPDHSRQDGNLLEITVNIFNVSSDEKNFTLNTEIWQGDYAPDVLIDHSATLPAQETKSFAVFAFLELMS
ncbi:MAG: hypothetical protein AAGH76_02965 [Pseudomonadota bacterium]